ncbi:hypothetical protein DFH28DRAFT_890941 [Melampsora americana]|nr:hypothetical protein DFH28DRAFT_890941 [Melampsora americana]
MILTVKFVHFLSSPNSKSNVLNFIQSAALVSLNCPDAFNPFWNTIRTKIKSETPEHSLKERLKETASLIRETNLKTISFIGIAKAINSLGSFYETLKSEDPEILSSLSVIKKRREPSSVEGNLKQALQLWKSIYTPYDTKLIEKLSNFHPDLPIHILHSHYGPLLSDPLHSNGPVGRIGTSLIAISTLRATSQLGPQLTSHVFGLKKSADEIKNGEVDGLGEVGEGYRWITSDEGALWVIEAVDKLSKIVKLSQLELQELEHQPKSKL